MAQLYQAGATFPVQGLPQGYLIIFAILTSAVGLAGAAFIGRKLVGIYVALQQVVVDDCH